MRILVTGANGFVGTEVVRQLVPDHEVLAVDALRYGPWRFSEQEQQAFSRVELDLRQRDQLAEVVTTFAPHAVIHLAAVHFIPECERLPHEAVSINVEATVNLLTACASGTRVVFASTAAVYQPSATPHDEGGALGPMDAYGISKLAGEHFVTYYAKERDLQAVIIRLFNVVGPGETNPHVLPEVIKQLHGGSRELRLGNTAPKRDYVFVGDAAAAFIAAAVQEPSETSWPLTANVGTGAEYSVAELVDLLAKVVGEQIEITTDPARMRASDRPHLCANSTRMQTLFTWRPATDLETALRRTWERPELLEQLR